MKSNKGPIAKWNEDARVLPQWSGIELPLVDESFKVTLTKGDLHYDLERLLRVVLPERTTTSVYIHSRKRERFPGVE